MWAIDVLDHLPDIDQALGPVLSQAEAVFTEAQRQSRVHGNQGFHTRRHNDDINAIMRAYGLKPASVAPEAPISLWQRTSENHG